MAAADPQTAWSKLAEVIEDPGEHFRTLTVGALLVWPHSMGRHRMLRICSRLRIGELKELGLLAPRQKRVLLDTIRMIAAGDPPEAASFSVMEREDREIQAAVAAHLALG